MDWAHSKINALQWQLTPWEIEELLAIAVFFENLLTPIAHYPAAYSTVHAAMSSDEYYLSFLPIGNAGFMTPLLFRECPDPLHIWKGTGFANEMGFGFHYARGELDKGPSDTDGKACRHRLRAYGFFFWDKERIFSWETLPKSRECGNSENLMEWVRSRLHARGSSEIMQTYGEPRAALRSYFLQPHNRKRQKIVPSTDS